MRVIALGLNYVPEATGIAPYTAALAEGLAGKGHDVKVLSGYPHYPEWQLKAGYSGWRRVERIHGVLVTRLRHFIPTDPKTIPRLLLEITFGMRLVLEKWGPSEAVLLVSPALFSTGLAIAKIRLGRRRTPVAIWVQDIYSCGINETKTSGGKVAAVASKFESLILGSADGVVVIHERFRDYLVSKLGIPPEKVTVIRNWTHLPPSGGVDREAVRRRLGWEKDEIIVLHAGNMGRKQGLENVVDAARLSSLLGYPVRFVLMGTGSQRKRLEADAVGTDNIRFMDPLPQDEFQSALSSADLLLVNELSGVKDMSVPSKLTSYLNAGVAVIAATDEDSITAEEISASGSGVRVDAGDPAALVEAARKLGEDATRRTRLGRSGLTYRLEKLSAEGAITQFEAFLLHLSTEHRSKERQSSKT